MPKRPRLTTQYRTCNKEINLDTLKREAAKREKALWPSREKVHLILEDYLPKDIESHMKREWLYQLEMGLKTRTANAFPVGSRRGLWLLETLQKLGFVVETGLSADKKWTTILSIRTPAEIRKEQKEQALPRKVLTTAKPRIRKGPRVKPSNKTELSKPQRKITTKSAEIKSGTQEQKPAERKLEREEVIAPVEIAKPRTSEEAIETAISLLMQRINNDKTIKEKELFVSVAKEILMGRSALGIGFSRKMSETIAIVVRKKLLDLFISIAPYNPELGQVLKQTRFLQTFEAFGNPKWVSPRHRAMVQRDEIALKTLLSLIE